MMLLLSLYEKVFLNGIKVYQIENIVVVLLLRNVLKQECF